MTDPETAYEKPARRITRYIKRPVEVEAWWWDGTAEGASPIIDWMLSVGATASYHDPPANRRRSRRDASTCRRSKAA